MFLPRTELSSGGVPYAVESVKEIIGKVPVFGICMGHQMLGQALGGKTYKMKFGHHGGNHPVRNLRTCCVEISAQNHNYAVDKALMFWKLMQISTCQVLMNLTNDNFVGCQQIAACGGLEILSSLIAGHFPSVSSYLPPFIEIQKHGSPSKSGLEFDQQSGKHLTDEELDFLVAILGLLVNLVEKDGQKSGIRHVD